MASTLNDFLASHGGDENAVFITLAANADKRGTVEESKLARGGVDPSVWAWYDQRLAGQTVDQAVEQATTGSQAFTQNLQDTGQINEQGLTPQEVEQNTVAQAEYQQRLTDTQAAQQTAQPTQQSSAAPQQTAPQPTGYTGPSIVDYLASIGQPSDFQSRALLAQQQGIQGYTGSAQQNTQLLNSLRSSTGQSGVTPVQTGIEQQIRDIQGKLDTFAQAEQGGLQITPQTSLQEAEAFLATPVGGYLSNLGIQANENWSKAFSTQPVASVQDLFGQIYDASGLGELKQQIDSYNKQIQDYDNELFDKIQEVNDNPWLTEGIRVKKVQQLQDKYENKKANYVAALNRAQGLYDSGREDARWAVSQTIAQYNADRNFQQGQLEFAIQRAESAAEAEQSARQQEFENELDLAKFDLSVFKAQQTGTIGGSSSGSGSSGGRTGSNSLVTQVVDGFQSIGDLTPSAKQQVKSELFGMGFGSDTPPDWFVDYYNQQLGERETLTSFAQDFVTRNTPQTLQSAWIKYRDSILNEPTSSGGFNFNDF